MYHNCASACSLFKGIEKTKKIYTSLPSMDCRKLKQILLNLIAKLTSVSGDCVVGFQGVSNLNWDKVGIS